MNTQSRAVAVRDSGIDWSPWLQTAQACWSMSKPTISLLVVVTAVPAMLLAANGWPSPVVLIGTLVGTFLASASASVFNHVLEWNTDQKMKRTRARPLPSGQMTKMGAITFASFTGFASLCIICGTSTSLAAVLALAANVFYVGVYTAWLKPRTAQNIVIGGAAGCVGPLIGWAAVDGSIGWPAWVLFAIIFLWTPPHFWALAIKYKKDYAAANIPMLPVVKGDAETRKQIFLYTLTLLPVVGLMFIDGTVSWIYGITAVPATMWFCWKAFQLWRSGDNLQAMPVFHYSCLYLFIVFGGLSLDRLLLAGGAA